MQVDVTDQLEEIGVQVRQLEQDGDGDDTGSDGSLSGCMDPTGGKTKKKRKRKKKKKKKKKQDKERETEIEAEPDTSLWGQHCCMGCTVPCECDSNMASRYGDDNSSTDGDVSSGYESDVSDYWNGLYDCLPDDIRDALIKHYNAGLEYAHLQSAPAHFFATHGLGAFGDKTPAERAVLLGEGARIEHWRREGGNDEESAEDEDEEEQCSGNEATVTAC